MYFVCCIYVLLLLNMPEMVHDWINKSILFYSILFYSILFYSPSWNIIINPFKLNGISHVYQLDQSTYVFRVVGGIFHFYSNF